MPPLQEGSPKMIVENPLKSSCVIVDHSSFVTTLTRKPSLSATFRSLIGVLGKGGAVDQHPVPRTDVATRGPQRGRVRRRVSFSLRGPARCRSTTPRRSRQRAQRARTWTGCDMESSICVAASIHRGSIPALLRRARARRERPLEGIKASWLELLGGVVQDREGARAAFRRIAVRTASAFQSPCPHQREHRRGPARRPGFHFAAFADGAVGCQGRPILVSP